MLILGLDIETTGLDWKEGHDIIEIGAVLWNVEEQSPKKMYSEIISAQMPVSDEITKLTGITQNDVDIYGIHIIDGLSELNMLAMQAEAVVAHNGRKFDKPFLEHIYNENKLTMFDRHWIDTRADIKVDCKTRALNGLITELKMLPNPFPHRAVFDVLMTCQLLHRVGVVETWERSFSPDITLEAKVSYEDRELAKERGFHWQPKTKTWEISLKELDFEEVTKDYPFRVVIKEDINDKEKRG